MRKYTFLCLTDDSRHSPENSLYAIVNGILSHEQCASVYIASRANPNNKPFFDNVNLNEVFAVKVNPGLEYDPSGKQFLVDTEKINPEDVDVIFLRLPRPVEDEFLMSLAQQYKHKHIINHPEGILETSTKAFLLNFKQYCPPMALCRSKDDVRSFIESYDCVLKPLKEYGGKGIVRVINGLVSDGDKDYKLNEYLDLIEDTLKREGMLAMKYLKNVKNGDKRLLVVNGEILAASLRMPPEDSWLCNVARGGKSVLSEATEEEKLIIKQIGSELTKRGILIFGADTLEDDSGKRVLSEINTLSIGGFPQAEKQTGKPVISLLTNKIFDYVSGR